VSGWVGKWGGAVRVSRRLTENSRFSTWKAHGRCVSKRNILAGLVGLTALLALVWVIHYASKNSRGVQRLPDGSYLRIVSVEYGNSHLYVLPTLKPWQLFLGRHLPKSLTGRFGLREGGGNIGSSTQPGYSNLAVIVVCEKANAGSFNRPELEIIDERGYDCNTHASATSSGPDRKLTLWTSTRTPVGKTLVLKFSEVAPDGETRRKLAEFHVPNPAAGTN
jgi:hypothetical protein